MERLYTEICHQHGKLMTSIDQRQRHPSYGITKARIREEYNELIGMLKAWLYVSGKWEHNGAINLNPDIKFLIEQEFAIDIDMAQFMIEAA